MFRASGVTDQGTIRTSNEDCFFVDEALQFCVVADGMGGHRAGEIAARIAVETIATFVGESITGERAVAAHHPFGTEPSLSEAGNVLRTAIQLANMQVLEAAGTTEQYGGMGTTIVAALIVRDRLTVGHVGDSRLYLRSERGLRQLTDDDSWMARALAEDPGLDPVVLRHHPMRNALTNVVGARPATEVHVMERVLAGRVVLLLTTDGVHGVMDETALDGLLAVDAPPSRVAADVVRAALSRGSRDNCTAVVGCFLPSEAASAR
jgi:protein phosphatase